MHRNVSQVSDYKSVQSGRRVMALDPQAVELLTKASDRKRLTEDECAFLLGFPEDSPEADLAIALADRFMRRQCDNTGDIGVQFGAITGPCVGRCQFCNFSEDNTLAEPYVMPDDVLREYTRHCVRYGDVTSISLLTIQNFDIDDLVRMVRIVRKEVDKGIGVSVNCGDLSYDDCVALREAGAIGAYHVLRLGEGVYNSIDPERRKRTIRNLIASGIITTTCTEPIGPEHTPGEIVRNFFWGLNEGCASGAVMYRVPVPGTPLCSKGAISDRRLEQIRAVLALASSWYAGPFSFFRWDMGYHGGFNKVFAEYAGSPRDTASLTEEGRGRTVEWARRELFRQGYGKILLADGSSAVLDLGYLKRTGSL